ncbi:uncharacterized protein (TIGR02413 family) [Peribacillus sp. B2I2]
MFYPAAFLYFLKNPAGGRNFLRPFYAFLLGRSLKGGDIMTLNMLFFTITIKMKKMTAEECLQQERIHKIREEHLDKAMKHRPFF